MAEVTVFVDDVVRGTLPALCVKEGIPTADRLTVRTAVGDRAGLGIAWLLLLAGPLGWLGLAIIGGMGTRADTLSARLPFCEVSHQRMVVARRLRTAWTLATVACAVAALLGVGIGSAPARATAIVLGAAAVAALVMTVLQSHRYGMSGVGVSLDASRRWVTLSGVHPSFADAARAQVRGGDARQALPER